MIETRLPVVSTSISSVDRENNIAVLYGKVSDEGVPGYTERGFVYSEIYENPTIYDSKIVVDGTGTGGYEYRCTDLSAEKEYYVRAYAINDKGVGYGNTIILFSKDIIELPDLNIAVQATDIEYAEWDTVNRLCENSTLGGYDDWRLPDIEELSAIYNKRKEIGNFATYHNSKYWTSVYESYDYYYYIVFDDGSLGSTRNYYLGYGRCVRTLTPAE